MNAKILRTFRLHPLSSGLVLKVVSCPVGLLLRASITGESTPIQIRPDRDAVRSSPGLRDLIAEAGIYNYTEILGILKHPIFRNRGERQSQVFSRREKPSK